ncbi:hypothetical protein [Rhizobium hidalgonense]|uniref:hypothetical protein n=1 Tax=Rhizobium hidalgonense TaxID=1538159 RepID=UPI0028717ED4|nr:hypothetical protein [Rhizobium hidalgonense]MDR9808232.1 hypothetical protein [Rhizobium hidalgonense]
MSPMIQELHRKMVEACIEQLIALLDLLDGDPDLEDNGDLEPSIDSTPMYVGNRCIEDLELDDCDDEESGDEEPTMGWSNPDGLRIHISGEAKKITSFDFDDGPLRFDGSGNTIARMVLRQIA